MAIVGAILAILLWSSLAALSVSLGAVPPLLLIGSALTIGGALSVPWARSWRPDWRPIAIGCYGMLAYHVLFVLALRLAPPVSANLVHYTWPMLIVLLSPLLLSGSRLGPVHALCAVSGFAGAGLAIAGGSGVGGLTFSWGYVIALGAGIVWATYSLLLKRPHAPREAEVGLSCLVSGVAALGLHAVIEPVFSPSSDQWLRIVVLGAGPMGMAFYLWAFAMRRGDPRVIGVLANCTPVLSSLMLVASGHSVPSTLLVAACLLVSASSLFALLVRNPAPPVSRPAAS